MSKGTYERRKAQGLCVKCGCEKNDDRVMCDSCRAKAKIDKKEWREGYIKLGICPACQTNPLMTKRHLCFDCEEKHRERNKKYSKEHTEETKIRYRKWVQSKREQGLCTKCGKRMANKNGRWCEYCLAKHRNKIRNKKAENGFIDIETRKYIGVCIYCQKPLDRDGVICKECADKKYKVSNPHPDNKKWRLSNKAIFVH